jgi:hypothetical protein
MKNSLVLLISALLATVSNAGTLVSGSAVFSINQAASAANTPLTTLSAFFGSTETRAQILADPGVAFTPGNLPFPAQPYAISNPTGRTLQATNVDLDPADLLGSWTPVANDFGPFVVGGEQIGLSGMMRWTGTYTGVLLFGDFALRYSPTRTGVVRHGNTLSGLVLTSNIDFANAAYADLANVTISPVTNHQFTITGDLVYSDGFSALTGDTNDNGIDFGNFTFTGTFAAEVPPQPQITRLPSGNVQLVFPTMANTIYRIQYSSQLADDWTTVTDSVTGDGEPATWTDSGPPGTEAAPSTVSRRFYRIFVE